MYNKDYIVSVSKYEIKRCLKNATKDILDNLMLCDYDIKDLDGDTVAISYKNDILVINNPTVIVDKHSGIVVKKGTYKEMQYAYEDMYTKLSKGGKGDVSTYLSFGGTLVIVELPCNRAIVERVWSDNKYIVKLLNVIISKRG